MTKIETLKKKSAYTQIRDMVTPDVPTLYTHPEDGLSARMSEMLRELGIPFRERSVVDESSASELASTGAFMTPLLMIGNQGFTSA